MGAAGGGSRLWLLWFNLKAQDLGSCRFGICSGTEWGVSEDTSPSVERCRHESRGLGLRDLSPAPSPCAKKINAHSHHLARSATPSPFYPMTWCSRETRVPRGISHVRNTKTDVSCRDSSSVGTRQHRQPKLKSWFFDRDFKLRLNPPLTNLK